jgi:hypothetical protein
MSIWCAHINRTHTRVYSLLYFALRVQFESIFHTCMMIFRILKTLPILLKFAVRELAAEIGVVRRSILH